MKCPYCNADAQNVGGVTIYSHRPDLFEKRFWYCAGCAAWVGCHPGTSIPMGTLANAAVRAARQEAHAAFDALWKGRDAPMRRKEAYAWLQAKMRLQEHECHIGLFTFAQCRQVVAAVADRLTGVKP